MADIKINKAQWDSLSSKEQEQLVDGLRQVGALKIGDSIVGDPNVPELSEDTEFEIKWGLRDLVKGPCKIACDALAAAGAAWCTANTAGVGLAACLVAAEAARKICRDRC